MIPNNSLKGLAIVFETHLWVVNVTSVKIVFSGMAVELITFAQFMLPTSCFITSLGFIG